MIDKNCEAWRMECEARHVVNLGGLMARRGYLLLVEQRRGIDARKSLEAAVSIEWHKLKAELGLKHA